MLRIEISNYSLRNKISWALTGRTELCWILKSRLTYAVEIKKPNPQQVMELVKRTGKIY